MALKVQLEDINVVIRVVNRGRTDNTLARRQKDKRTHSDVKTLCRNIQIDQKPGMNSCAREG